MGGEAQSHPTLTVASLELSSQQLKTSSKHKAGAALSLWWEPSCAPLGSMGVGQVACGPLK